MSSFLLCIGNASVRSLPVIMTALSCGAASPASLNIFSLLPGQSDHPEASSIAEALTTCHHQMEKTGQAGFFPAYFSLHSCHPVFRSTEELSENPDTALLFSALRGKGLPLSLQTDPSAVEWCFADLLSRPEDPSIQPFFTWLEEWKPQEKEQPSRLTLLADLSDPFSAGIVLTLLPILRERFPSAFISVIAIEETSSSGSETFFPVLSSSLRALEERGLLRMKDEDSSIGADALWLLSLPSSMAENPGAHQLTALAAARILGSITTNKDAPAVGLHTKEIDGTLSLSSLGEDTSGFLSFLQSSAWLLADLFPSLRNHLSHPARLRGLTANSRNGLFRQLFPSRNAEDLLREMDQVESALKKELSVILDLLRNIPVSLRLSAENISAWQDAVNACGRYITVASEYDVSSAEARESGLDVVKPVHRVSLADTEEEMLVRRLEDMKQQLQNESDRRDQALALLGGYRSQQVRLDCLLRCRQALSDAKKLAEAPRDNLENLEILKRERRVRLLEAAVSRCESELAPASFFQSIAALPVLKSPLPDPYAGTPVTSEFAHFLESVIQSKTESAVRIPSVIDGLPEPDQKQRLKSLLLACHGAVPPVPLFFLLFQANTVCREETASLRFHSNSGMPPVPLLPDIITDAPLVTVQGVLSRLPAFPDSDHDRSDLRGLLAMLLLRQYRRRQSSEAILNVHRLEQDASPVLRNWLSVHGIEEAFVLSLESAGDSLPYAVVLPGKDIIPARRIAAHTRLVPSFVTWFDREKNVFRDPCVNLGEGDRKLLHTLLSSCVSSLPEKENTSLLSFLQDFHRDLSRDRDSSKPDKSLETRLQAVCGLSSLAAYESSLEKVSGFYEHFLPEDVILSCITGIKRFLAQTCNGIPEEILYLYRGVPFAREDSALLLDSPHAEGEDYTLKRLREECALLSESSDDYRDSLCSHLPELLSRCPEILPEVRETATAVLDRAQQPVDRVEPSFTWPWDMKSPSMQTVLRESLGDQIAEAALDPFSEGLAVFPARGMEVIGDSLLSSMCCIFPEENPNPDQTVIPPDAVLPPFSPSFGKILCTLPEGRTLLKQGLLSFKRQMDENASSASFRVTLTLDGVFPVHLIRVYTPDDIHYLYAHDIPTLALWPSVPFRPQDWHAYFVYAHLSSSYSLAYLSGSGVYKELSETSESRFAAVLDTFPVCFSLSAGDKCLGILPNVLPEPLLNDSEPVEICLDFGSSGTSVVFSTGRQRRPMQGPVLVRTLLNNPASSRDLLRREFLPAVPVSALLPTVTRVFQNRPGSVPSPFCDGIILMSANLEDLLSTPSDAIYTSLKWEEEKGRSGFLCLHQVMLMAALQARFEGASSLSWRFSLPDEMAKEGRESLMNLFLSLAENVIQESGYPVPPEGLPVSFASESFALGAYFRYCAPDDTRGGFMVLDLGACTADISLFLRGREQAVRTCQIPLGIHYMLLPSLLRDPDLLLREFSFYNDESFRRDLSLLTRAIQDARTDPVALRRARIALDLLIGDDLSLLVSLSLQLTSSGYQTKAGALLLLHLAYLLMLSGLVLLQLAADPSRNDFLPEQMSLCMSGRGASLLESLPPQLKTSLWHFLSMFRNKRVASLSLLFSAEKKMEIPVGLSLLNDTYHMLPPASAVPASIAVRPAELLPEFLLRFRKEFPISSEILFPGFFTNDYYHPFSDRGESLITASIDQSFPPTDTPRPYDSLAAWLGNLLDLL